MWWCSPCCWRLCVWSWRLFWNRALAGRAGGIWRSGARDISKRVRLNKKTPHPDGENQYVHTGVIRHDVISEDGMGQETPKRWKRHHVEDMGDRPCKRFWHEFHGSGLTRGSETLILVIGLPNVLQTVIWGRRLKAFRADSADMVLAEWMG